VFAATARLALEIFEDVRGGAAEFKCGLRRDRFDICSPAHTVGAEDFF